MWPELRKQIAVERALLNQLIEDHRRLLEKCAGSPPDAIELPALAAMLHGLYNGVENVFKRVAIELDEGGPAAHRPPAISVSLADRLSEYLGFRHFFRSACPSTLRWDQMAGLVAGIEEVFRQMEDELSVFLQAAPP